MDSVLHNVKEIILKCKNDKNFTLPCIKECNLGGDYINIVSVTGHENLQKGLVCNIIGRYKTKRISTGEYLDDYDSDYGEYVLYKIEREWDTGSLCKSTYYFIK